MLEPQSRTLLIDALKPPPDYQLDFAVGTTFTLDLMAMLVAPLSFALLDRTDAEGKVVADPLALLEALRRNANRFAVFCQTGRIAVPKPDRLLLSYLEKNVIEVKAPTKGGVFHPKVWVLRFVSEGQPVSYRMICASRNLTFDRSWDTVLTMDGLVVERKNAIAANHPLGDFVAALPELAVRSVGDNLRGRIEQVQAEVRKVYFEVPDGFESYGFCPLGIEGYRSSPFKGTRIDRLLAVSPFISAGGLEDLRERADEIRLVSRLDELQKLDPEALKGIEPVQVFSDEQTEETVQGADTSGALEEPGDPELTGLHAKLYIADAGWNAYIWTGSANATSAALRHNVEFLAVLEGKKKACGIAAFLGEGANEAGFASFLKPFVPADQAAEKDEKKALEDRLEEARVFIGALPLKLRAMPGSESGEWRLQLLSEGAADELPAGVAIRAWPITCKPETIAKEVDVHSGEGVAAVFHPITFEALTTFVALEVGIPGQALVAPIQFVLNLPGDGFPEDRHKRLLLKLLDNADAVLRYIELLLDRPKSSDGAAPAVLGSRTGRDGAWGAASGQQALLEPLLRALHEDPAKLDDVARLVSDLREAGATSGQIPEGFEAVWQPIWEARQRLGNEKPAA